MLKQFYLLTACYLISAIGFSQVVGKVTDAQNQSVPFVNIYVKDSYQGTTSNQEGNYELNLSKKGPQTIVFQFLGFQTVQKTVDLDHFPFILNVSLKEETTSLDEVVIKSGENPANRIIRHAIADRKKNLAKIKAYTADYYSRGLWKIKNAPEKILGQEVGDLGGGLDSTRSGIIYLSETISKIKYQSPDDFHEKIIASKVSGDDNGFSLNSAQESNFSFYNNTVAINAEVVSPIADYAFNYYTYQLDGIFYDDNGNRIDKIKVTPKRPKDRVFSGFIYIVHDVWEIYGVKLNTTGSAIQIAPIEKMLFQQNFKFDEQDQLWVKLSQTVGFSFSLFGISGDGRFSAVYSNYNFHPDFSEKSFGNELQSFASEANKKDSVYWEGIRPIPLTDEELRDYVRKDSIQIVHDSKPYKDSIDGVHNRFKIGDLLFGYDYQNSEKKYHFGFSAPVWNTHFNTVKGWNIGTKVYFRKEQDKYNKYWEVYSDMDYGFADDRFRIKGGFLKKFNNRSKPYLQLEGGIETKQINDTDAISERLNDVTNIFFERNYLKLYDRLFAEATYSEELFNGFRFFATGSFEQRTPLFNHTDQVIIRNKNGGYTANNPLQPGNFGSASFQEHNIVLLNLMARINFDQKYYNYPDGKYNVPNSDYPTIYLGYEKGFASTISDYNFDHFKIMVNQKISLQNKGLFEYSLKAGKFLHDDDIALLDYQHFSGNQTRVNLSESIVRFGLLPYYDFSANDEYAEFHFQQNFTGWVLGKIPFLNRLNFNLLLNANILYTSDRKPYSEFSVGLGNLGFGKYRFLRVDYVKPYYGGWQDGAFVFGLSIGL